MKRIVLLMWLLVFGWSGVASAAELRVAVAANFLGTLQQLAALYEEETGDRVTLSAGSSGALYAQIVNGAPFDLFFSADAARPAALVEEGLADPASRFTYALGVPVLWSDSVMDMGDPRALLAGDSFRFLALADPRNAPYGVAAQQILTAFDLWDALDRDRRLVRGQTITQTYSQIASGAAELGFVALAQVKDADGRIAGSHWIPPAELYDPITQDVVMLARARNPDVARQFLDRIRSERATGIIEAAGYQVSQ